MSLAPQTEALAKPETLLRVPLGLASPLWGLFAGAAMTGATWWWMTRWARPQNLEAMFAEAEAVAEPGMAALATPVAEAVETVIEATPEAVLEATVEATPEPVMSSLAEALPEPVAEALIEAAPEPIVEALPEARELEPVGGQSAPISPVLEALAPQIAEPAVVPEAPPVEVSAEPAPAPKPRKKAAAPGTSDTPD